MKHAPAPRALIYSRSIRVLAVFLEFGSAPRARRSFSMSSLSLSIAYTTSLTPSYARISQVSEIAAVRQPYIGWNTHTHIYSLSHSVTQSHMHTQNHIHMHIHTYMYLHNYTHTTPELTMFPKSMAAPASMSTFTMACLSLSKAYASRLTPSCQ